MDARQGMQAMQARMAHEEAKQAAPLSALLKHLLGCAKTKARNALVLPLRSRMDTIRPQTAKALPNVSKRILGYAAQIALLAGIAFAQSPVLVDGPFFKSITIGPDHCYFWMRSPSVNDVHTACYFSGALIYNAINTLGTASGSQGKDEGEADWNGTTVKWCFTLGTYTLSVTLPDGTIPLSKSGTF